MSTSLQTSLAWLKLNASHHAQKITLGPTAPFEPGAPGEPTSPYMRERKCYGDSSDSIITLVDQKRKKKSTFQQIVTYRWSS